MNDEWSRIAASGICHWAEIAGASVAQSVASFERPSVLFRPALSLDGSMYCALYGQDLMSGVAGFGETVERAMYDFDRNWREMKAPQVAAKSAKRAQPEAPPVIDGPEASGSDEQRNRS